MRRTARVLLMLTAALLAPPVHATEASPRARADEVLAADRAFAARAGEELLAAFGAMLHDDATMPASGGRLVRGRDAVLEVLRENPANVGARGSWKPIRVGLSGDGTQAFTYGYLATTLADGKVVDGKYLSYWIRGEDGWRVAAYKRTPRAAGDVDTALREPALPAHLVAADPSRVAQQEQALVAAEQAFSDEAQAIGLGAAFAKQGSADAMNMGGPGTASFVFSAREIARKVDPDGAKTSPLSWSAERALVASSGDLGVTFGFIRPNQPDEAGAKQPPFPFFTVWRRAAPGEPWRYVAE